MPKVIHNMSHSIKPTNQRKTKIMGNNAAFTAFENAVVKIYKRGKLDKQLLADMMETYRDTDIDSGGKRDLFVTKNGRNMEVEDIVIEIFTGKFIEPPTIPKDYKSWTTEQDRDNNAYHENRDREFGKITEKFGWC